MAAGDVPGFRLCGRFYVNPVASIVNCRIVDIFRAFGKFMGIYKGFSRFSLWINLWTVWITYHKNFRKTWLFKMFM